LSFLASRPRGGGDEPKRAASRLKDQKVLALIESAIEKGKRGG
jgi:hypothetical protein